MWYTRGAGVQAHQIWLQSTRDKANNISTNDTNANNIQWIHSSNISTTLQWRNNGRDGVSNH